MRALFKRPSLVHLGSVAALAAGAVIKRRTPRDQGDVHTEARFREWLMGLDSPTVIELGTRRTETGIPTLRREWAPTGSNYVASDFMAGEDVDVVADAEHLSARFQPGSVDAVIACSVFEHIRKPWLAAAEIGKVLKPGGRAYVTTHFAFPLHSHPYDYWRFTREALETLFGEDNGFRDAVSFYAEPCFIVSEEPATLNGTGFLGVGIMATKG